MIKVGIIGFGKMGKIRATAVKNCGGQVISVYDANEVDWQGYNKVDSPYAIFNNSKIDAVFICTPNYLNKELTIKGLESGKHVFCEKPPAFTAKDVEEIIKAEKNSGKKLQYGFNHRHHESVKKIKEIVDSGKFGKILWMRGRYGKNVDEKFFDNWRADKSKSGGGILIDQGIHMLDLFLYMADNFDQIKSFVSNQFWKIDGVEDNAFVIFKNSETGTTASLHSTMTQWRHLFSFEIFLEKGYMVLNGLKTPSGSYGSEELSMAERINPGPSAIWPSEEKITYQIDGSWNSEVTSFFTAIKNDELVKIGNSNDALKIMKIIDTIYAQNKEDK